MELNEGSHHYLENFYLLEQVRNEATLYLKEIASGLHEEIGQLIEAKTDSPIVPQETHPWILSMGGETGARFSVRDDLARQAGLEDWKYYITYRDATQTTKLSEPTSCFIFGSTPKANGAQIRKVSTAAAELGLPDPYRSEQIPLLDAPAEEVVERLAGVWGTFFDDYIRIIESLLSGAKD